LPVVFVVFLIHAVPFLLMQPFLHRYYGELAQISAKTALSLVLVSVTGGFVGTVAIVKALFLVQFDMVSVVVVLQKLQPLFAIGLATLILRERVTRKFILYTAIALLGAYLLTFGFAWPTLTSDGHLVAAAALALLAAASFGAATTLGKMLVSSVSVGAATLGRYGITTALALLATLTFGPGLPFSEVSNHQWLIIGAIGLTSGSGAIALYYWGLKRIRATVATICELCLPLSAVVLDYAVNGTVLTLGQWLGAATLLGAILKITLLTPPETAASTSRGRS
jgi:drug/metabolite transporter (DMT)-like permease